jgi:hypothetical protein
MKFFRSRYFQFSVPPDSGCQDYREKTPVVAKILNVQVAAKPGAEKEENTRLPQTSIDTAVLLLRCSKAPSGVDSQTASTIRSAIAESFIFGFRLIMLLCAGLATASAGVAWWKIPAESAARVPDLGAATRLPVVDCCHALQEKKDQEKASKVKHCSHKTGEENSAQETGYGCEEDGQEETIEEEGILKSKSNRQEGDPSTARPTLGVVLGQRRRSFGSPIGRPTRIVPSGASEFGKRRRIGRRR